MNSIDIFATLESL